MERQAEHWPPRDRLVQELYARIGGIHALLEVDTDPVLALAQLRQAQAELDEAAGWLADQVLIRRLTAGLEHEDTIEGESVAGGAS
jgi:hypothetical protein